MCGYYPVQCLNNCGKMLHRGSLENHIGNERPLTVINCDFQQLVAVCAYLITKCQDTLRIYHSHTHHRATSILYTLMRNGEQRTQAGICQTDP